MTMQTAPTQPAMQAAQPALDPEKVALNKRLETIGWGLFLIMIGGIGLIPNEAVPKGLWSVGVGLIMLGLNAARYYYGIKMSTFTLVLGILALLTGIGDMIGANLPVFGILLILIGANMIIRPMIEKDHARTAQGGEEES